MFACVTAHFSFQGGTLHLLSVWSTNNGSTVKDAGDRMTFDLEFDKQQGSNRLLKNPVTLSHFYCKDTVVC